MKRETLNLWKKEEYHYPVLGEFLPNLTAYLHEDDGIRSAMIVVPGGAYRAVSPTEAEIVAKKFYDKGYQAFVVTYTVNLTMQNPLKMQPLMDLTKAVLLVRQHAKAYHLNPDQVAVCGFSAGGHLAASLAVHYEDKELADLVRAAGVSNRPDAVILSYPVISSGEYAHHESFLALLGEDANEEEIRKMSLEKQVKTDMPPVFLWQTATDEQVPVENSYMFAMACKKAGVLFEHHVFPEGLHGMSVADRDWAEGRYGSAYTLRQLYETIHYLQQHDRTMVPEPFQAMPDLCSFDEFEKMILGTLFSGSEGRKADKTVAIWPDQADAFLHRVWRSLDTE